jgi:hypothetical protein
VVRRNWSPNFDGSPVATAVSADGSFWLATSRSLNQFKSLKGYPRPAIPPAGLWTRYGGGPGNLPAANITSIAAMKDYIILGTDRGCVGVRLDSLSKPTFDFFFQDHVTFPYANHAREYLSSPQTVELARLWLVPTEVASL